MERIRTLIVDDEELARLRLRNLIVQEPDLELIGECSGGKTALAFIRDHRPQLVFLDIQMKEVSGFDVVTQLESFPPPLIIFVTAYDQYAVDAFDANAIDYLLKPFSDERFNRALARARTQLQDQQIHTYTERLLTLLQHRAQAQELPPDQEAPGLTVFADRLMLKTNGRLLFLDADQVNWIEADGVYVRLHVNKKTHLVRESLSRIETRLDPMRFIRIHRSTIVNMARIKEIAPHFNGGAIITLQDGTTLKLSRSYRDKVSATLGSTIL